LPLVVPYGWHHKPFIQKAKEHPWLNKIKVKVLGDNINLKNRKPFPDPYLLAAYNLNVKTEESFAIEDSFSGFTFVYLNHLEFRTI